MVDRLSAYNKYRNLMQRLEAKIGRSQIPVPGFIVGLSGSDSILTFLLLCSVKNIPRVVGIHYVNAHRRKPTWFEEHIIPWLREKFPDQEILVESPLGGNRDQQRWADLHLRSLNHIQKENGEVIIKPRNPGDTLWVSGSMNATEKLLGKYSLLSNAVSIQPIQTVYKSEVLAICEHLGVPSIALEYARLPDCLCGREELAANNIDLIDKIFRFDPDVMQYDQTLVAKIYEYIKTTKQDNDFKMRVPYIV